MANRLLLRDRRNDVWGNVSVRLFWEGGGQDGVWVNGGGSGDFSGSGIVDYVDVAGEKIGVSQRVDGNSTIVVKSQNTH